MFSFKWNKEALDLAWGHGHIFQVLKSAKNPATNEWPIVLKNNSSNWGYIGWLLIKFQIKPFWTNATCVNGPVKKRKKKNECVSSWSLDDKVAMVHECFCIVLCCTATEQTGAKFCATNRKYLHTHKSMYTSRCWTAIHTKADTTDAQPRLLLLSFFSSAENQKM